MRKLTVALLGATFAAGASGQDALQCVEDDVRAGLLWQTPTHPLGPITRTAPPAIAALGVPSAFTWIAGVDRDSDVAGAFKTTGDTQAVLTAAVDALARHGWETPDDGSSDPTSFASETMQRSQTVCREGDALSIQTRSIDNTTYVMYALSKDSSRTVCGTDGGGPRSIAGPLEPYMPRLDFATLDPTATVPRAGSRSGSSVLQAARVRIQADLEVVASELARQLAEQGWERDAGWSGTATAGSTWRRSVDGRQLAATLDLVDLEGSQFEIAFDVALIPN